MDVMCFDKTGTLTEEGLDVLGARSVNRESNTYSSFTSPPPFQFRTWSSSLILSDLTRSPFVLVSSSDK